MKYEKLLTISIAAYNVEEYLEKALDSLITPKSIDKLQIIIVSDGSTDKTSEIAMKYVESYPDSFVLIDKNNGGYGSTINASLKIASGKYFRLLDGDDWFENSNIDEYIAFLKKTNEDMVLTQYTNYYEPDMHSKLVEQPYAYNVRRPINKLVKYTMHSMAVKTEIIQNNMSITEHCFYTDVEWFLKVAILCDNFVSLPLSIYCYRLGREGQSMSIKGLLNHLDEHDFIARLAIELCNENKKISGLQPAVARLAVRNFNYLLLAEPSENNKKKFLLFRDFLSNDGKYVVEYMKPIDKLVFKIPVLYRIVSILKRKRHSEIG